MDHRNLGSHISNEGLQQGLCTTSLKVSATWAEFEGAEAGNPMRAKQSAEAWGARFGAWATSTMAPVGKAAVRFKPAGACQLMSAMMSARCTWLPGR